MIHTSMPSSFFFAASTLGFNISSAWTSSIEFASYMASLSPWTSFGTKFKHAKAVEIGMGDMESLSTYTYYWKSSLVPHILLGHFDFYFKLKKGWTFHQLEYKH